MKAFLNCQKVKQVFFVFSLISIFFSSVAFSKVSKKSTVETLRGVVEMVEDHENALEVKLNSDKRFLNISNLVEFSDNQSELLRESLAKKTVVEVKIRGTEITSVQLSELKVGDVAPVFKAKTHEGKEFDLSSRNGKWTVLYFYPKSDTPGCTKQACAFRDSIKVIRELNADVFGVSADSVEAQKAFHKKHNLSFVILADPEAEVIRLFGAQIGGMKMSSRWTFILGPDLKIQSIDKNVDPVLDAQNVAKKIKEMQAKGPAKSP